MRRASERAIASLIDLADQVVEQIESRHCRQRDRPNDQYRRRGNPPDDATATAMIERIDRAMYEAKQAGRNRAMLAAERVSRVRGDGAPGLGSLEVDVEPIDFSPLDLKDCEVAFPPPAWRGPTRIDGDSSPDPDALRRPVHVQVNRKSCSDRSLSVTPLITMMSVSEATIVTPRGVTWAADWTEAKVQA